MNPAGVPSRFSNHRDWRDFVAAMKASLSDPAASTYPKIMGALKAQRSALSGVGGLGGAQPLGT